MIMVSLGMLEGSYVTEGLCNAAHEWQCELYQSDVELQYEMYELNTRPWPEPRPATPSPSGVGRGSWQSEQTRDCVYLS